MEKTIKKIFEGMNFGERDINLLEGYAEGHDLDFKIKMKNIVLFDKESDDTWANNMDEILELMHKFNREIHIDVDYPDEEKFEDDETIINIMEDLYNESKKYIFTKDELSVFKDLIESVDPNNLVNTSIYIVLKNAKNQLDDQYIDYIKGLSIEYRTVNPIDIIELLNAFIDSNYMHLVEHILSIIDLIISNMDKKSNSLLDLLNSKKRLFAKYFDYREIKEERNKIYNDIDSLVILKAKNIETKSETLFSFYDVDGYDGGEILLNTPEGTNSDINDTDEYKITWTTKEERLKYLNKCVNNKILNKLIATEYIFKEKESKLK